jgi:hypothetical protein
LWKGYDFQRASKGAYEPEFGQVQTTIANEFRYPDKQQVNPVFFFALQPFSNMQSPVSKNIMYGTIIAG